MWLAWRVHEYSRQRKAVNWVLDAGGTVLFDYQLNGEGKLIGHTDSPNSEWRRRFYHEKVVFVYLDNTIVQDLTPLADLKKLRGLDLSNTKISKLTPLAKLKSLERLTLANTQVDDVTPLANSRLQWLILGHTAVKDVTPLASIESLQWLSLAHTSIRDVTPLSTLKNLRELSLIDTAVTDEQVEKLQLALPNCTITRR
jgi:hypothetical protein